MVTWEYRVLESGLSDFPLDALNKAGAQGWELIQYWGSAGHYRYFLKRRLVNGVYEIAKP
jgi:hypothetical protein